jgi:hypothetical protein
LSVDPLKKDYPELTPYQFASNTPIQAIDLDGLEAVGYEWSNNDSKTTLQVPKTYAVTEPAPISDWEFINKAPLKTAEMGYGTPETHRFSLTIKATQEQFNLLKATYTTHPENIHNPNNSFAEYMVIENPEDSDDKLEIGDGMIIDIALTYNGAVRFTEVIESKTNFSISATTIDAGSWDPILGLVVTGHSNLNHPDAGNITFSATYNEQSQSLTFSVENTTSLGNWATALAAPISRWAQSSQWKQVLNNVQDYISKNKEDVISKTHQKNSNEPIDLNGE